MKNFMFASAVALMGIMGSTAFAGGLAPTTEMIVEVPVVQETSWTGPYAGLSYGRLGNSVNDEESDVYTAFAGYRHQFDNNFVVGGEVGFGTLATSNTKIGVDLSVQDVEFQVGYALGDWLPYAAIGQTTVTSNNIGVTAQGYGVGVDYAVSDNVFVGASYMHYEDVVSSGVAVDRLGARVGWMF